MKRLSDSQLSARGYTGVNFDADDEIENGPSPTGDPDKYIAHLQRLIRSAALSGCRRLFVVLYARVSSGKQLRNGNLAHQMPELREVDPKNWTA